MSAMFTLKQMEAFYWMSKLGSFEAAAEYLHITQSTVSKRIGELESRFPTSILDRSSRRATLTAVGQEVLQAVEDMLHINEGLIRLARAQSTAPSRFRLGVTDLVAYSWLPRLLEMIGEEFPQMVLEPEVGLTKDLRASLSESKLDFIICPRIGQDPQMPSEALDSIEMVWMCSPRLGLHGRPIPREELLRYRILIQSRGSVLRPILSELVDSRRLLFKGTVNSNNMMALAELAAYGLGVTVLPRAFFKRYIEAGQLCVIETDIRIPPLEYAISYREDYYAGFYQRIAAACREVSDFSVGAAR